MSEEKLNPSGVLATESNKPSVTIMDVESFVSGPTKPKNPDMFVNLDELNPMKRRSAETTNVEGDKPDAKGRGKKPVNYAAKKTVAQGMMDIALITSNANQLKSLFDYQSQAPTFYFILLMIIISLLLQVSVGVSLIFKGRYDTKGKDKAAAARVNKWVMSAVFVITVINIFIAVFSTTPPAQPAQPAQPPRALAAPTTPASA